MNKKLTNLQDPAFLLRYFLFSLFLAAATFRLFNFPAARAEMAALNLPESFAYLSTSTEILIAAMMLSKRTVMPGLLLALSFLCFAISSALVSDIRQALAGFWDLFVFNNESTDIALHCTYVVIIVVAILMHRKT